MNRLRPEGFRQVHDGLVTLPKRPTLAEISTEIAALEEVIQVRHRMIHKTQLRPDFRIDIWERDAKALAGLVKRLKSEREVIAREARG